MKIVPFLKQLFIPHKDNDYKPHFFREHILLTIFIGSILMLFLSFTSYTIVRTTEFGSSVVTSVLIDLTNQTRKKYNLLPLSYNQKLKWAATLKGEDMKEKNYFSHYSPDGTSPWYWFDQAGYTFLYAGENLAINFANSDEVERAWLASKKHRDNILNINYKDIGIATVRGNSNGVPVLFIVQMFGTSPSTTTDTGYSALWYEILLFNGPLYVAKVYAGIVITLIIALLTMILVEIKKQHVLHIIYGILLILVVFFFLLVNSLLY